MKRIVMTTLLVLAAAATAGADRVMTNTFRLLVGDLSLPYREGAVFVLPDEKVALEVRAGTTRLHRVEAPKGMLVAAGPNRWSWRAPRQPGDYDIEIKDTVTGDEKIEVNAFVMVPAALVRHGILNGYRIGSYPAKPLKGDPSFTAPPGFIEVTERNQDTKVSPHFRLKQFLTKQPSGWPKYLVLDERLVMALETISDLLEPLGYDGDDIHVMSGYRTPFYNKAIGNVGFSQHQWGRAADIFIDKDKNGTMDDLNKDKRVDRKDAVFLFQMLDRLSKQSSVIGGLGVYGSSSAHGPFVHVDVRGRRARW